MERNVVKIVFIVVALEILWRTTRGGLNL